EHVVEASFADTPEGRWVAKRAREFGFRITYTDSTVADTGILPEPWHLRYLGAEGTDAP
ncbi:MAG: hypothetical protein HKO53_05175, partial [Gemmatimonadetes bacterium]|nr:hypothetical protein [Gemmatimonadota bacterium]